jgi:uncharacterized UPF0160 family protein
MIIVTHHGVFHADDVFAVATLLLRVPHAKWIRTRDPNVVEAADIVVDVGGVYDPERGRFDHHQRDCTESWPNGIKKSSFGMVWSQVGRALCSSDSVFDTVTRELVMPIDASDNGQALTKGAVDVFEGVRSLSLSAVIATMNGDDGQFDVRFARAVAFAQDFLRDVIARAAAREAAKDVVLTAIQAAGAEAPVVVLPRFVPWQETLVRAAPSALFVVFPAETGDTWMVQSVPVAVGSFQARKLLPESWAGLRDAAFSQVAGVPDGVFCHQGRFICGARSLESAKRLASLAVQS